MKALQAEMHRLQGEIESAVNAGNRAQADALQAKVTTVLNRIDEASREAEAELDRLYREVRGSGLA